MLRRYAKLAPAEAEAQWKHQYESTAEKKNDKGSSSKAGWRVRELVLIGGLVLPIWGMVEQALVKQHRPTDRRMHVLRLQTTGWLASLVTLHCCCMLPCADPCVVCLKLWPTCCAMLCCAAPCRAVPCHAVLCCGLYTHLRPLLSRKCNSPQLKQCFVICCAFGQVLLSAHFAPGRGLFTCLSCR